MHLSTLFVLTLVQAVSVANAKDTREYCLATEAFEAKCMKNEIIIMHHALYGRMKMGGCLKDHSLLAIHGNDPRFLGCSTDVLSLMDEKCSGTNQCEIAKISESGLPLASPCYEEMIKYLEASFDCVSVVEADRNCIVSASSNPLHIMHSSRGSSKLSCGTKSQPWRLEAPAGQQINVSMINFGTKSDDAFQLSSCISYGYIIDAGAYNKNVSICGFLNKRYQDVYKSSSNVISLVFNQVNEELKKVIIGFKAVGCFNLVPPEDTWLRRNENEAVIGCYSSHQTWHLHCVDNQWVGVIGNCTHDLSDQRHSVKNDVRRIIDSVSVNPNEVIIITAIACLAVVICAMLICCGFVCLKRHYAITMDKLNHRVEENGKYFDYRAATSATAAAPILVQREMSDK